jgi:Predicted xylanase/chitin deacetylase
VRTLLKKATGYDMKPYVRPPYGAKNNTVLNAISDADYTHTVLWNVDTNDWKKKTSNEIVNHVLANAGNGNIVLMHTIPNSNSAKALPKIIEGLQSSGYKLVSISELLEASPYIAPKLGVDEISEVEFLNNLLYTKTGSFLSTAEEIKKSAAELSLIEGTSNISFSKAYTKEEMIAMIKKLYPLKSDIDKKFANVEFKKSNLEQIIKLLKE